MLKKIHVMLGEQKETLGIDTRNFSPIYIELLIHA
jgi:hypothetical protein